MKVIQSHSDNMCIGIMASNQKKNVDFRPWPVGTQANKSAYYGYGSDGNKYWWASDLSCRYGDCEIYIYNKNNCIFAVYLFNTMLNIFVQCAFSYSNNTRNHSKWNNSHLLRTIGSS